ncbi:endothelin-converting enzyme 2 [Drosophila pseudoobscura]|uniref:Endothelin-converting enzyme 2 n=2 Tax=Drosophila pseudoobscura TaxID=7237 RepID=A0A6I8V1S2_DROPS|nr:endothelin-converting enzyme 2 [Drosophila pseudoobscura]
MLRRVLLPLWGSLMVVSAALALPADDLTSDYAKSIIRQSKVADIKAMLKPDIAPCDDFYSHACGNWHRQNPAQLLNDITTDTFKLISKGFDRRLQSLLRSNELKTELEQKLQRFYLSCGLVHRDDVHYKLALENVYREYGEIPALAGDRWNASNFTWWQTVGQIQHKYGRQIILAVDIMRDIQNKTVSRVYLGPPDYEKLSSSGILNLLEEASSSKDLQRYFGLSAHHAKQTAEQLHALETRLMSSDSSSSSESIEDNLSLYTLAELEEKYGDHMNFTEFFALVLGPDNVPETLYIYDEPYLDNALSIVKSTPPSLLATYVLWQLMQDYLVDATPSTLPKWCVEKTKKYFGKLTDHAVYARYRSAEGEAEVHSVWDQIRSVFRQQLAGDKHDWITNATRQLAIEKLDSMQLHINSYDSEDFEELYGAVAIDRLNYVANVQQLNIAQAKRSTERIKQAPSTLEDTDLLSFTPAYNILENNITIPVALLQPRYFWGDQYPQALKYATLGYLLAHEMIHGFDVEGRNYDAGGNLAPWWDLKSRYEFEERRKCFQAQYHAYKYGGFKLPESTQQSENIADNAGVKLAYAAYERWLGQQSEEKRQQETMEGLDLNNRQLFFVGFAQLWCDDVQTLFKKTVAQTDSHAPGMYRVIGSLSNFQEFSWVFNCSQSAPMDPEYKCSIY